MIRRKKDLTPKDNPAGGTQDPGALPDRPTINDIARFAAVSKKTVSRVLNKSPFVAAETREKISWVLGNDQTAKKSNVRLTTQPAPLLRKNEERGIASIYPLIENHESVGWSPAMLPRMYNASWTSADRKNTRPIRNPRKVITTDSGAGMRS